MGFCNSCGRPIVKADYGTNADGSLNDEYCKDCFQNGEFTEPDITLEEMITRKTKEMMEKNPRLPENQATGITVGFILRNNIKSTLINHLIFGVILLLLFLMGLSIGTDNKLISVLPSLGLQAIIISFFSTFGSIIAGWIIWIKLFKKK